MPQKKTNIWACFVQISVWDTNRWRRKRWEGCVYRGGMSHRIYFKDICFTSSFVVTLRYFLLSYMSKTNFSHTEKKNQDLIFLVKIPCYKDEVYAGYLRQYWLINLQCWPKMLNVCPLSLSLHRSHITDLKYIKYDPL